MSHTQVRVVRGTWNNHLPALDGKSQLECQEHQNMTFQNISTSLIN